MTDTSLRFHLREHTQSAHERLDQLVGDIDSPERYGRFVSGSYAHRLPVERFLGDVAWPEAFGEWRPGSISGLIAADLEDLAISPPECPPFTVSNDIASLLGVAYVVEGSALGARLIRKAAGALGFHEAHGGRHLARQSQDLSNWQGLLTIMDNAGAIDRQRAVDAANLTFDQATQAMQDNGFG